MLSIVLTFFFVSSVCAQSPIYVKTRFANYEGRRLTFRYDIPGARIRQVDKYYKIRYVEPPTGANRFKPPRPLQTWRGRQDATKLPPLCPQSCVSADCSTHENEDEDCLYVNVFSPYDRGSPNKKYPVMVYIHGGSYEWGGGRKYIGDAVARYGVVMVSFSYRLGFFGFFTTGDSVLPGNYGLKDQIAALKWVKENIQLFNGDPNQVTIVGHSAGSSSVSILITLPKVKGLFRYAIAQSGAANSYFGLYETYTNFHEYFIKIMKIYNCPTDLRAGAECIRRIPWRTVMELSKYSKMPHYHDRDASWKPRIDGDLIPEHPYSLMQKGVLNPQKFINGVTSGEISGAADMFLEKPIAEKKLSSFHKQAPNKEEFLLALNYTLREYFDLSKTTSDSVTALYTANKDLNNRESNRLIYASVFNDYVMGAPTMQQIKETSKFIDTYQYFYTHFPEGSQIARWMGPFHGMELSPLFGAFYTDNYPEVKKEQYNGTNFQEMKRVSANLMYMWTHYVKTGEPKPLSGYPKWPKYQASNPQYAEITDRIVIKRNLRKSFYDLWERQKPSVPGGEMPTSSKGSGKCDATALTTVHSCHGNQISITCANPKQIKIIQAHFGRVGTPNDKKCNCNPRGPDTQQIDCGFHDMYSTVQPVCEGKQRCSFKVDDALVGLGNTKGSCQTCCKYLEVTYMCIAAQESDCHRLGTVDSVALAEGQITASSYAKSTKSKCDKPSCPGDCSLARKPTGGEVCSPRWAVFASDNQHAWCPEVCDRINAFLQIDLGNEYQVTGVIVQGCRKYAQWVTKYGIKYSSDGKSWSSIEENGKLKEFTGNTDSTSTQLCSLQGVQARYVRVQVLGYQGHPCMHVEILRCGFK